MDFSTGLQLFNKGGLVMYPLIASSIAVLTIGLERYLYYRSSRTDISKLWQPLSQALEKGDQAEAIAVCRNASGDIANILVNGLGQCFFGQAGLRTFLETEASIAIARRRERLGILEAIVTLAPLLGLLGTVIGMIESFNVMAIRTGQPQALTGGVGEALIATGTGLVVAIFAFITHSYFANRLDTYITDMEQVFGRVINIFERGKSHEAA